MSKKAFTLFITFYFTLTLLAQENKQLQDAFLEAEFFLMNEDYPDALNYYLQVYESNPENANIAYCIGICYLNIPGKKDLSVRYLEFAVKNLSAKRKEGTLTQLAAPYEALYFLAKAYHINYKFDKAKETYKRYRETILPEDRINMEFIDHEMKICDMAKDLIKRQISYSEENLGELFNDEKANFNPIISNDGKSFAFMVTLKFYDAVMLSKLENGKWTGPVNIYPELEVDGDISISCLSRDGRILFLSKDDNDNSDIYSSEFDGSRWLPAVKLNRNINTKYWESHAVISEDESQLIFASDRPGGLGGLDLFISRKVNGEWGPAVNMGPEVNTQFNEDRPFLINNKTLFFSSQGHENMGGYDLFRSDLNSNGTWNKPVNMGYPLNTPDDNVFFMPEGDGRSGYYFRDKESGGYGKEDIYRIEMK